MARLNDFMAQINLSPLIDYCREHGRIVRYAKGDRMVHEGDVCRFIGIVQSGYFKYTSITSKGDECVTGFSFAGEVATDYVRSFMLNKPAMTSIVAGCDTEIMQVPISEARPYMLSRNPEIISEASSILLQEAYRRYLSLHTLTPAERYIELYTRFHDVISTIPYQEIASYLSVSRRQLQRIRESIASMPHKKS